MPNDTSSSEITSLGLLGILFVGLKLTGFIDWSWLWVTIPFWGGLALLFVGFIVYAVISIIVAYIKDVRQTKRRRQEWRKIKEEDAKARSLKARDELIQTMGLVEREGKS